MEARATRMEGGRRLLHHVEEEDLQLDWVDRLLMRCPDNPIIYDPEFRCPCFTIFFGLVFVYWWMVWIIKNGKDTVFS